MSLSDTAAHRLRRRAACRRRHLARPLFSPSSSLLFVDYLCRIHLSYYKYAAEIISPSASVCFSRSAVKTMNQARCAVTLPSGSVVCSLFLIIISFSQPRYLRFDNSPSLALAIAHPHRRPSSPRRHPARIARSRQFENAASDPLLELPSLSPIPHVGLPPALHYYRRNPSNITGIV